MTSYQTHRAPALRAVRVALIGSLAGLSSSASAAVLWTTTFSGIDQNTRTPAVSGIHPSLGGSLTSTVANLTFASTAPFTGSLFKPVNINGAGASSNYFSPNINVDNPGAAGGQNGGSWQSEFHYSGGIGTIALESVTFNVLRTNSTGATQTPDGVVRDVLLTAEYSVDGGANWLTIDLARTVDLTASVSSAPFLAETYPFGTPLDLDLTAQDLWLRFKAENTGIANGGYVNLESIQISGSLAVPEPSSLLLGLAGAGGLLFRRSRRQGR